MRTPHEIAEQSIACAWSELYSAWEMLRNATELFPRNEDYARMRRAVFGVRRQVGIKCDMERVFDHEDLTRRSDVQPRPPSLPKTGAEAMDTALKLIHTYGKGRDGILREADYKTAVQDRLESCYDAMSGVTADAGAVKVLIAAINSPWDDYWDNRVHEQLARFTVETEGER